MKQLFTTRNNIVSTILSIIILSGFSLSWIYQTIDPNITVKTKLSESQANWSRFIDCGADPSATKLSTVVDNEQLIILKQATKLRGIATKTGKIKWTLNTNAGSLTNPVANIDNTLFVATDEPRLLAVDASNGHLRWSIDLPHTVIAKINGTQNQIFVKTVKGDLIVFDAKDGTKLWHHKQIIPNIVLEHSSMPQLIEDKLLVGFANGTLIAFEAKTGDIIWKHQFTKLKVGTEFAKLVDIAADPIVDIKNNVIYVSAFHGNLKCLSLKTGITQWENDFSGYMPIVLGKYLYGLDTEQTLYAFDPSSGAIVWKQGAFMEHRTTQLDYRIVGPVLHNDGKQIILGDSHGNLYWLSEEDGQIIAKASFNIASPILHPPLSQENNVYTINKRGQMASWKQPTLPLTELERDPVDIE